MGCEVDGAGVSQTDGCGGWGKCFMNATLKHTLTKSSDSWPKILVPVSKGVRAIDLDLVRVRKSASTESSMCPKIAMRCIRKAVTQLRKYNIHQQEGQRGTSGAARQRDRHRRRQCGTCVAKQGKGRSEGVRRAGRTGDRKCQNDKEKHESEDREVREASYDGLAQNMEVALEFAVPVRKR